MGVKYFWDSYAVIELIKGNTNYSPYSDEPIKICIFNLVEIYWFSLHEFGEQKANEIFNTLKNCVLKLNDETLKEAVKFRKRVYANTKISYADAVGYICAKMHDLKFLTGDSAFEHLDNVEFVL
jgi:hypothetical protein